METVVIIFCLFVAGVAGGFLSGLLGIGGGVVYVFVLTQAYNYFYSSDGELGRFVIANSLFVIFCSSLSSTFVFKKIKAFYPKEIIKIGVPSIIILFLLTIGIVSQPFFSPQVFNVINLIVLLYIFYSSIKRVKQEKQSSDPTQLSTVVYVLSGLSAGTMAALTGLGGGTILNPILNGKHKLALTITRSISLGVIMVSSFGITVLNICVTPSMSYGDYTLGYINFLFCIPLVLGALLSSATGARIGNKLSSSQVMLLFSVFIFLMILKKVIALI